MMTKEEIIDLAEQSGFLFDDGFPIGFTYSMLKDFAKLIAEKEREACASICEDMSNTEANMNKTWRNGCKSSAEAIRAREQK